MESNSTTEPVLVTEARKAYVDYVKAQTTHERLKKIAKTVPKYAYSKRRNGKKVKLQNSAIRTGSKKGLFGSGISRDVSPLSKSAKFSTLVTQAYVALFNANEKFQAAAKKLTDEQAVKLMNEMHYAHSV